MINSLRIIEPEKLYVHIDGPRSNNKNDDFLISECMKEIEKIDWQTKVEIHKQEKNLGCMRAVVFAIDWAFEYESKLIILEDDIKFESSFIDFCNDQLSRNENNERIMLISGYNPINISLPTNSNNQNQVLLSSYPMVWGWATWKNQWKSYYEMDPNLNLKKIQMILKKNKFNPVASLYFIISLFQIQIGKLDTWDFQLYLSCLVSKRSVIIPIMSLTSNVGFRADATHTKGSDLSTSNKFKPTKNLDSTNFDPTYRKYLRKNLTRLIVKRMKSMFKKID